MAKGKPTKEETKAKVVELKMNNPELSSHDIEKMLAWTEWEVSNDTVCDIINALPQLATTEKGMRQIERLDSIVGSIEEITNELVINLRQKKDHTINDVKTLNEISKTNWERSQLLKWKATANVKVSGFREYSTEELLKQLE